MSDRIRGIPRYAVMLDEATFVPPVHDPDFTPDLMRCNDCGNTSADFYYDPNPKNLPAIESPALFLVEAVPPTKEAMEAQRIDTRIAIADVFGCARTGEEGACRCMRCHSLNVTEFVENDMKKDYVVDIEACAKAAHEANRIYCTALGDLSVLPWAACGTEQQNSIRRGVERVLHGDTPEQLHESWMAEKLAAGWVHGPVKDAVLKTHPCLLPYADLTPGDRAKDLLFDAVVRAMVSVLPKVPAAPSSQP